MTTRIPITKENGNSNNSAGSNPVGVGLEERQKKIWRDMEDDMNRRRREWEEEIDKMRQQFFLLRPHADALGIKDDGEDLLSGSGSGGGGGASSGGLGEGGGGVQEYSAVQGNRSQESAAPATNVLLESSTPLGDKSMGSGGRGLPYPHQHHGGRMLETNSSLSSPGVDDWETMVTKDDHGNPIFKVVFDVREYRPEEVSVRMDRSKVSVSAKHQAEQEGSSVSRQYSREVSLPSQLDPLALQCLMAADGTLTVEAPLPAATYAALKRAGSTTTMMSNNAFPPPTVKTGSVPGHPAAATAAPPDTAVNTASGTPLQQSFSSSSSSTSSSYQSSFNPPLEKGSESLGPHRPLLSQQQQQQQQPQSQQQQQQQKMGGVGSGLPPSDPVLPPYQPPMHSSPPVFSPYQPQHPRPDPVLLSTSGLHPASGPGGQNCQLVVGDGDEGVLRFAPSSSSALPSMQQQQPQQKMSNAFSSTSSLQQQQQTYHDSSSPELPGFSLSSPPFHSLAHQQTAAPGGQGLEQGLGMDRASLNGVMTAAGIGNGNGNANGNGMMTMMMTSSPDGEGEGEGEERGSPDPSTFKLEVDIEDFKPEELTVKTQDRRVVVCARREEKAGNRTSSREMSREHTLPDSVDPLTIKAFFTDGGRLIIEAPFMESGHSSSGLLADHHQHQHHHLSGR